MRGCEEEADAGGALELSVIVELGAVVGGDGFEQRWVAAHEPQSPSIGVLFGSGSELADEDVAGFALDEGQEAVLIAGADDGVDLPVADLRTKVGRASCGASQRTQVEWKLAESIPANAQVFRSLADANLLTKGESFPVQSWFSALTGQVMLCRTKGSPKESCFGEWWAFREDMGNWVLFEHDGWFCVT